MRPISNSPIPQTSADYDAAGAPPAAGSGGTTAQVQLPPRVGNVYSFNDPAKESLTPESYREGLATRRLIKSAYLDFMLLGVVPKADVAHLDVMLIIGSLVDTNEFAALEFLLERCGPVGSLTLYCDLLVGEGIKELADILYRTQPGISTLNCQSAILRGPQCSRNLKVLIDACPRLTAIQLGRVNEEAVNELNEAIRSFPDMAELTIGELIIENEATGKAFCEALTSVTAVSTFKLGYLLAPEQVKTDVLQCLSNPIISKRIVRLNLNFYNFLAPAHLDLLLNLLRQCPALDELLLDGCSLISRQIEALCTALKEAPGPLQSLYLKFDWPATKLSKAVISVLTDIARCRTGLRGIFGSRIIRRETSLQKGNLDLRPGRIHEDYGHPSDGKDAIWARFEACYAPLVDLLERNEALWDRNTRFDTEVFARLDWPVGPYNLEKDSGSLLAAHILAHSDSVQQFEQVMAHIEYTLTAKSVLAEEIAPTSTASSSATLTRTSDTDG